MRAVMLTSIASVTGWSYKTGDEVCSGATWSKGVVPTDVLAGWVERKIARPIPEPGPEAATHIATETTAAPRPRGRPRGR